MISEKEILNNITADEKFKIICRARNIDIDEVASDIYKTIDTSNLEEKREYIGIGAYEDEYMDIYDVHKLYIDSYLLYTKDDWIKAHMDAYPNVSYKECELMDWDLYVIGDEFTEQEKEFIQLALDCEVTDIVIKWLP